MNERLQGQCPSCGAESLFVGSGGYVTCSVIGCKEPGAAHDALVRRVDAAIGKLHNEAHIPDIMQYGEDMKILVEGQGPGTSEMLEANRLVNGNRQADYGTPRENYEGVAKVWSGILSPILKRDITPSEAALLMVGLKLQRQAMKHKRDNLVDAHGYLLVYSHIEATK